MRAVVTRVKNASVVINEQVNGQIGTGFLVLLGVGPNDTEVTADKLADKICNLRVFEDENEKAIPLYERFMAHCRERGFDVQHGEFGADMQVYSQNDGPVTILFDTEE